MTALLSRALIVGLFALGGRGRAVEQQPSFDYDTRASVAVTVDRTATRDGAQVREISYADIGGRRNKATLVEPRGGAATPRAGVLFVHWYDPPDPTSNRTEFLNEAVALAAKGAVSLLIDTPWAKPDWFPTRDSAHDYDMSVEQVKAIRRAIDVLLAEPHVDPGRVAYVGHDFGAMYGAVASAVDPRVKAVVFMAGARSFSEWFLFTPKREGAARERVIAEFVPLDPIGYLPRIAPRPLLLQFGTQDRFVSALSAKAMAAAARDPKTVTFYDAPHGLNAQAASDRRAWLQATLRLEK